MCRSGRISPLGIPLEQFSGLLAVRSQLADRPAALARLATQRHRIGQGASGHRMHLKQNIFDRNNNNNNNNNKKKEKKKDTHRPCGRYRVSSLTFTSGRMKSSSLPKPHRSLFFVTHDSLGIDIYWPVNLLTRPLHPTTPPRPLLWNRQPTSSSLLCYLFHYPPPPHRPQLIIAYKYE